MATRTLQDLKEKMDLIKSDIAKEEGKRSAALGELEREFGIKSLASAYKELDKLQAEIDLKKEERESLTKDIQEKLAKYGY